MAKRRCDICGEAPAIPVVYGLPSPDLMESAARGEVLLGGCEIGGDDPVRLCARCASSRSDADAPVDGTS